MIVWREKLVATTIHFVITLVLAGVAASVIFLIWYPDPFHTMIGGTELFLLIVGSDLALGPLMSLVIYNSSKSRRELFVDYGVIGVIQVAALVYGVTIMADARPVYVAFHHDRYEIVLAGDLKQKELAAAREPKYREVPWNGPRLIGVSVPEAEREDAMFESISGNEEHVRPRFYVPMESLADRIRERAKPLPELQTRKPASTPLLETAMRDIEVPVERLAWLPVRHFRGFWTVIIDTRTARPVAYIDFDPY